MNEQIGATAGRGSGTRREEEEEEEEDDDASSSVVEVGDNGTVEVVVAASLET